MLTLNSRTVTHSDHFEAFLKADFRLLLLGVRFTESATFLHHIEAVAAVPYREWMDLPREYVLPDGDVRVRICRYYGRMKVREVIQDFEGLEPVLLEAGVMTRVETHFGASRLVALRDLFDHGMAVLAYDPYSFIKTQ